MNRFAFVSVLALVLVLAANARADDAGADATVDAAAEASEGIQPTTTPDNWNCAVGVGGHASFAWPTLALMFLLRRRKVAAALAALTFLPAIARADDAPPKPKEDEPQPRSEEPTRRFALSINPASLLVDRYGASVEVLLASHHVIEGGAYYVYCATNQDAGNVFQGFGGEVGYRFYLGQNGPRGFYVGPSFLFASLQATPQTGAATNFWNFGGALDVGYQALVADRVLFGLGAGAQYSAPTTSFPSQQVPASVYANAGFRPRVSLAIGVAF